MSYYVDIEEEIGIKQNLKESKDDRKRNEFKI